MRRIMRQAYENVPLYRSSFKELGLTPADFARTEDIKKLPTMTKLDLVRNFPDRMMARNVTTAKLRHGTGTAGLPMAVALSSEEVDVRSCMNFRRMAKLGVKPWNRVVTIWAPDEVRSQSPGMRPDGRAGSIFYSLPLVNILGRPIPSLKIMKSRLGQPQRDARDLYRFQPDYILSKPSNLRRLGRMMKSSGLDVHPRGLSCAGEIVTDTEIAEPERLFDSRFFNSYGSSEFGATGFECTSHMGTHLSEDFVLCEMLKGGEPAGPGETGELVMTHLHNLAMPLLRYRTGDMVQLAEAGTCECGSNLLRLKRIKGRVGDGLVKKDGTRLPPIEVADYIESKLGLSEFQLTQTKADEFQVKLQKADLGNTALVDRLRNYLEAEMETPVKLVVTAQSDAELWAKSRPVTSKIA